MKKKPLVTSLICMTAFLATSGFYLQDDPFNSILSKLNKYNEIHQQEKVHIHLDKPYYAVGEDIWFKAYVLNTLTSEPSQISNTLYVELIDPFDHIIKQVKIPLSFGMGWGDFILSDSLSEGNYRLRAYTRWMKNAGTDFFYDKTIKIGRSEQFKSSVNSSSAKSMYNAEMIDRFDLQAFPEGGNLVENIPSKIAIKTTGPNGLGLLSMVSIKDKSGAEISNTKTIHAGMGLVILNPQPGQVYTATATLKDGRAKTITLPAAQPSGCVLSANTSDSSKIGVKIMLSQDLLGKGDFKILALHNNNIFYSGKVVADKQVTSLSLPSDKIQTGILQLTLFGPNNTPLCERLTFVNNPSDKLNIQMDAQPAESLRRAKMTGTFRAIVNDTPTPASFSIAINNISKVQPDELNESNIYTDLLLTSDLPGYIERPNYYFLKQNYETRQNLDLLMMTHGWRRFVWKDILSGNVSPTTFQPEKLLSISGKITKSGKPLTKAKVSLLSKSGKLFVIDTLTDNEGRFSFNEMFFGENVQFIVKTETPIGKSNVNIDMDASPRHLVTKNKNTGDIHINVNEALSSYLSKSDNYFAMLAKANEAANSINLETVNIVGQKKAPIESANFNGPGNADYIFTAEVLETKNNLYQALMGRVAGLNFRSIDGVQVPYLNKAQSSLSGSPDTFSPVRVIVDGITIDPSMINDINLGDVASIEVLSSSALSFVYGTNSGVLVITSKRGSRDTNNIEVADGSLAYTPQGYYTAREFFTPKYEPGVDANPTDFRTTIYWKPNLITDGAGNASFEYFNGNEPGLYRVVIEGIDAQGHLARKVYTYELK